MLGQPRASNNDVGCGIFTIENGGSDWVEARISDNGTLNPRHFFPGTLIAREWLCVKLSKLNFKLLKLEICKKPPQFPEAVYT
ncbi:hypothetical protein BTN45_08145 [Rhizobium sp. ZX09]|nr:hypothetical protein BTN45_08145 [Rhizobium sp. ZX09]